MPAQYRDTSKEIIEQFLKYARKKEDFEFCEMLKKRNKIAEKWKKKFRQNCKIASLGENYDGFFYMG